MVNDAPESPLQTAASLVTGILGDLQVLVEQQFQLTRCEIEQELHLRVRATVNLGTGLAGCFLSALMLSLAAAHLLHWAMLPAGTDAAGTPLWVCESGVAVVLCGIGLVFVALGRRQFLAITSSQNPATSIFE